MPITTCALADDIKTIGAINIAVRSRTFSPLIWSLPPTVAAAPRFFLGYGGVPFSLIPDFRLKIALTHVDGVCRWKGARLRILSQFELLLHFYCCASLLRDESTSIPKNLGVLQVSSIYNEGDTYKSITPCSNSKDPLLV